jgi:UDP-N-acetylmuramate dehydrogenase
MIDEAGLKGFRIGGAAVSEKHAGFVVNLGGATAEDVKTLLAEVARIVYEKTGIHLEPEVRIW